MNTERKEAYQRSLHTIKELRGSKLHDTEYELLQEAAQSLLLDDEDGAQLMQQAEELLQNLVVSERWIPVTAESLLADLHRCGE